MKTTRSLLSNRVREPDPDLQNSHHLAIARDAIRSLASRTLIVFLPVLLATIAIGTALQPHLKAIKRISDTVTMQEAALRAERGRELEAIRGDKLDPSKLPKSRDGANTQLQIQAQALSEKLGLKQELIERTKLRALSALQRAGVEVPIPGANPIKVPLYFAAMALQFVVLSVLIHLGSLRNTALWSLEQVSLTLNARVSSKYRELASPPTFMALPFPREGLLAELLGVTARSMATMRLLLVATLGFFVGASLWLLYLNLHLLELTPARNPATGHAWFGVSLLMSIVTVYAASAWLLDSSRPNSTQRSALDRSKRHTIAMLVGGTIGVGIAAAIKPRLVKSSIKSGRQGLFRLLSFKPRYKKRSSEWLTTEKLWDGFLVNNKSKKSFLVAAGRIVSVPCTAFNARRLAAYLPEPVEKIRKVSYGLTTIAIERAVLDTLSTDPKTSLKTLRTWIVSRLPKEAPEDNKLADLRLIDLYAKLCIWYQYEDRLKTFVALLRSSPVSLLIADRLDRWSDPKSKWRKRVLDYGRCSSVGYPVAGRCGFESRPAALVRKPRQWFAPTNRTGESLR